MRLILYRREGWVPRALPIVGLLLVLVLTSCGEDSGATGGPKVTQRITRDFGRVLLSAQDRVALPEPPRAMRLLRDHVEVDSGYRGELVEGIDGLKQEPKLRKTFWQWYVNGIETDPLPPEYKLYPNDVVQWDLRYWRTNRYDVRATVGAFPEFFTSGFDGERFPVRVLCADDSSFACRHVKRVLRAAGVRLGPGPRSTFIRGRVLVGPWEHWRDRPWPKQLDRGPIYSGVFARFSADGEELRLLDRDGRPVRSERGDVGLVAAQRPSEVDFMWLVTGLNEQGVDRAARAMDSDRLRDAYALVVTPDGDVKVPTAR